MTDREILSNAIDKAIANGYKSDMLSQHVQRVFRNSIEVQLLDKYLIIVTHDFAKAFWGEDIIQTDIWLDNDERQEMIAWQYHLQQMVLEENPIKYLEKFL